MALTMTRGFMLLAVAVYAMRMADQAYFGVNATLAVFIHNIKKMLRIGAPLALANGLESVAFALVTFFAGWLGAKELATFQDALNLNAMIFMLAIGIATATAVRVATCGRPRRPSPACGAPAGSAPESRLSSPACWRS